MFVRCLGCDKEARTKKGWCGVVCYRTNQSLVENRGKYVLGHQPYNKIYEWVDKNCLMCNVVFRGKSFSVYCSMDCVSNSEHLLLFHTFGRHNSLSVIILNV